MTCAGSKPGWTRPTWPRNWPALPRNTPPTGPKPRPERPMLLAAVQRLRPGPAAALTRGTTPDPCGQRRPSLDRAGLPGLGRHLVWFERGSQGAAHQRRQVRRDARDLADVGVDQGLVPVTQRHLRLRVHVDDHAVRAHGGRPNATGPRSPAGGTAAARPAPR